MPVIRAQLLEHFGDGLITIAVINVATRALKKALIERALAGELKLHLGYSPGVTKPAAASNQSNDKGPRWY